MLKSVFTFQLHHKTVPSLSMTCYSLCLYCFCFIWLKLLNAFVDKGRHLRCPFCSNDVKLHPNCHQFVKPSWDCLCTSHFCLHGMQSLCNDSGSCCS